MNKPTVTPNSPATKSMGHKTGRGAPRLSFAKIAETLDIPDLLAVQADSFEWLIGSDAWRRRVQQNPSASAHELKSGLEEVFEEMSPIEDHAGTMQLSFRNPVLDEGKYTIDECKEKGKTYSAPMYVEAEFMRFETGEIKTQTVFIGDFPLMTDKGTFIVNGTERVVVSQLVRSPGVYFKTELDKTADGHIHSAKIIPSRGAWLEFEVDKKIY